MAGPAIRMVELGRALAADGRCGPITVASLGAVAICDPAVELVALPDGRGLQERAAKAGSVVIQGDVLQRHPRLGNLDVPLVVDVYDPFHLEQLERINDPTDPRQRAVVRDCISALNAQLARADLVLCASGRQRSLWLGHLAALGRLNPMTHHASPDLSELVVQVPFGRPAREARPGDRSRLAAVIPALGPEDLVAIWGGGIYEWLDPQTLVRAMASARDDAPRLKLVFLGAQHPVADVRGPVAETKRLAHSLGVLGETVFFVADWVPYDERDQWLGAADLAVSTHHHHLETEFAFRTRVIDYLWCGLPVISTSGDELADRLRGAGAGIVVPPEDVAALGAALTTMATSDDVRHRAAACARALGRDMTWSSGVGPLADFCAAPRRAPDLMLDDVGRLQLGLGRVGSPAGRIPQRIRAALREGGPALVTRRLGARMSRRAGSARPR